MHGLYLSVERVGGRILSARGIGWRGPVAAVSRRVAVWHLVCLSWLFFRCQDFDQALAMFRSLGEWGGSVERLTGGVLLVIGVGYLTQLLDGERCEKAWDVFGRRHPVTQGALAALAFVIILGLGPTGVAPFIYFQF